MDICLDSRVEFAKEKIHYPRFENYVKMSPWSPLTTLFNSSVTATKDVPKIFASIFFFPS